MAQFKARQESLPDFLKNEGTVHFLAWTTTPWTLPSNTALTVGPKIDYVLAKSLVNKQFDGKYFEVLNKTDFNKINNILKDKEGLDAEDRLSLILDRKITQPDWQNIWQVFVPKKHLIHT